MAVVPQFAELELNPVFAGPSGGTTAAADARITLQADETL